MSSRLFHAGLTDHVKEQLVSGFQDERVEGEFKVRDAFLRPQVLCGVQSALGTGVNLFAGNVCVFMEPYGQPAHAKQAVKRLHRRGQTRDVYVFRLTCADKDNGVLAERIILKRANARDMFAEGIFQSKLPPNTDEFGVDNDEENVDDNV